MLGHFFLFCNTFRLGAQRSLLWIASFVGNVALWTLTHATWLHVASHLAVTLLPIVHCIRHPTYHGIACERFNPTGFRDGAMAEGAFTRGALAKLGVPKRLIFFSTGKKLHDADLVIHRPE